MSALMNPTAPLTMSTREIAELLEKQHGNIKISAERLSDKGVIGTLALQEFTHNGNTYTEYLLNKRDSLILVAQNCPEFTARIVDRWQELEAMQQPKSPAELSRMDILHLAMESEQARIEAEQKLALAAPKVEFVDQFVRANGSKGFRAVCKLLNAKEPDFRLFLVEKKIMYRLGDEWMPYQQHIDAGRFEIKAGVAHVSEHAYNRALFTPKGVNWVAAEWAKHRVALVVAGKAVAA
ncbi:phage antirepressor KilAC domain-containing protein [Comamonas aquatica]|nr:phage antirepressor KilAC domain-containing protein [Comamonas aquatica]